MVFKSYKHYKEWVEENINSTPVKLFNKGWEELVLMNSDSLTCITWEPLSEQNFNMIKNYKSIDIPYTLCLYLEDIHSYIEENLIKSRINNYGEESIELLLPNLNLKQVKKLEKIPINLLDDFGGILVFRLELIKNKNERSSIFRIRNKFTQIDKNKSLERVAYTLMSEKSYVVRNEFENGFSETIDTINQAPRVKRKRICE